MGYGHAGACVVPHILCEIICVGLDPVPGGASFAGNAAQISSVRNSIVGLHEGRSRSSIGIDSLDSIAGCLLAEPNLAVITTVPHICWRGCRRAGRVGLNEACGDDIPKDGQSCSSGRIEEDIQDSFLGDVRQALDFLGMSKGFSKAKSGDGLIS